MKKRIFVLYTGGTIGMQQGAEGLKPDVQLASCALKLFAEQMDFDWHIMNPLIDSSAVGLQHWQEWLHIIEKHIAHYDGVLVLHGTDTLAYTANILALALSHIGKPIVLTGSQLPYNQVNSDAPSNLATAVAALNLPDLAGVYLVFNQKLFPAIGCSKVSTETVEGFTNPHFSYLAHYADGNWQFKQTTMPSAHSSISLSAHINEQANIAVFTLIPGMMLQHITQFLLSTNAKAVILQTFGHGNAPANLALIQAVQQYTQQGGLVLNISQCQQGCAAAVYAEGNALRQAGIINGGKCNLETATALLTLAVSQQHTAEQVQQTLHHLGLLD